MYQPDPGPDADVLRLINEVPKAFFQLSAMAERAYADLDVGGPERGVLRDLFLDGAQAAPDIARKRPVSRQAVQQVLSRLLKKGLVALAINPRHKRSPLFVLTKTGIQVCVEIQERDLAEIARISRKAGFEGVGEAIAALEKLNAALADELSEGGRP